MVIESSFPEKSEIALICLGHERVWVAELDLLGLVVDADRRTLNFIASAGPVCTRLCP